MRQLIREFVRICAETLPIPEPIYEFESLQVPGQEGFADLRPFFPGKKYIGSDIQEGPGVDVILDLHNIDLPAESAGTVIVMDTFEHVEFPRRAVEQIYKVTRPNGTVMISSHMREIIHAYPNDYWRFTPECFKSLLKPFPNSFVSYAGKEWFPHTVVGIGFKGPAPPLQKLEEALECWRLRWDSLDGRRPKESFLEKNRRKLKKSFQKRWDKIFGER